MVEAGTAADWAANALTAVGMIATVGIVLYQLGKQHRSSLKLQRSNAKEALKLRVYELLVEKAQAFSEKDSEAASYARSITREFESAHWAAGIGLPRETTSLRAQQLSKLHYEASGALVELTVAIEVWEIAFPAAELFRVAFSSASRDIDEAFNPFFNEALRHLPTDLLDGTVINQSPPTEGRLEQLRTLQSAYLEARTTLRTYTHDLVVEAQNLLLAKLFKRRVKVRNPIDPAYKVITAADTTSLMKYFKEETLAGREWEEANQRVRESVASRNPLP